MALENVVASWINDGSVYGGNVADVVVIAPEIILTEPFGLTWTTPHTSQSPAVNEIEPKFVVTPDVKEIKLNSPLTNSPTLPAAALLLVVVPITPDVELNVMLGVVMVPVKVGFAKFAFRLFAVVTNAVVASCNSKKLVGVVFKLPL